MQWSWSNFNLRLPGAYLVLSYLIATVLLIKLFLQSEKIWIFQVFSIFKYKKDSSWYRIKSYLEIVWYPDCFLYDEAAAGIILPTLLYRIKKPSRNTLQNTGCLCCIFLSKHEIRGRDLIKCTKSGGFFGPKKPKNKSDTETTLKFTHSNRKSLGPNQPETNWSTNKMLGESDKKSDCF